MESTERSIGGVKRIGLALIIFVPHLLVTSFAKNPFARSLDLDIASYNDGTTCNATLYDGWYDSSYSGALVDDLADFWLFSDAELTNGQALEVVSSTCQVMMNTLRLDRAGRNGPAPDKYIYDVMCSDECILSDAIREQAMSLSGCTCLELSTQPTDPIYHAPGDWCAANSGRILCETFGQCGRWACNTSDFMCPRYEYNKHEVPHRGKGDCSKANRLWQPVAVPSLLASVFSFTMVVGACAVSKLYI